MTSANLSSVKIPIFDGVDFSDWKWRMELIFEEFKLLDVVQRQGTAEQRAERAFNDRDIKARRIIAEGLSSLHLEYAKRPTAYDAWQNLCRNFEGKNAINRCITFENMIYLKCEEDKPLHVFYKEFDKLQNEYTAAGGELPDLELITIFMSKIPKKYKHVKSALQTIAHDDLSMDRVRTRLLEEEMQEKREAERETPKEDSAIAAAFKTNKKVYPKKIIRCYICGDPKHKADKCPKRQKRDDDDNFKKDNHRKDDNNSRFVCFAGSGESSRKRPLFAIDTGCSQHMISDISLLSSVKAIEPFSVEVAKEGQSIRVSKGGSMSVKTFVKGRENELLFSNVCYAPGLSPNLISVSRLDDLGFNFTIRDGEMTCYKDGKVAFVAMKRNGLYWADFDPYRDKAFIVVKGSNELWHRRLGHINMTTVTKMSKGAVEGIKDDLSGVLDFCECCVKSKQCRLPFNRSRHPTKRPLEKIHSDVCGPFPTTFDGYVYFVTFIDDYTHMCTTYLLKRKSEVLSVFKMYKARVEAQFNRRIASFRSDNGGEYTSEEFKRFCKEAGIVLDYVPSYTPQLNGVSERMNRTLCDKMRAMLNDSELDQKYWGEALLTATYLTNRTSTETLQGRTPYELWYRRKPDLSHLRVFGCRAYSHIPKPIRGSKLADRGQPLTMIGYTENAYRLFDEKTGKIIASRNVIFDESRKSVTLEIPIEENEVFEDEEESEVEFETAESETDRHSGVSFYFDDEEEQIPKTKVPKKTPETQPLRRSTRERKQPDWFTDFCMQANYALFVSDDVPKDYDDVQKSECKQEWRSAIKEEVKSLMENETWKIVKPPKGAKLLTSRWIFKKKSDEDGNLTKYKARLVAKGYMQKKGIDYGETYAPVARMPTIRLLLAIGIQNDFLIEHMDVKTAFLYGHLKEEVYMKCPQGIKIPEGHVLKLRKSLYGLRQSPRCWNERFHNFITKLGFERSQSDYCLYSCIKSEYVIYLVIYVDDLLIVGSSRTRVDEVKRRLSIEFAMKDLGTVKQFMGLRINVDRKKGMLTIDQTQYAKQVLAKFKMSECNPVSTPMESNLKLDRASKEDQTEEPYRELLGSLMYLMIGTRPDLCFAIGYMSRFQDCCSDEHYHHLKRILRYVKGTVDLKLEYKRSDDIVIKVYADADYANDIVDRKSTTGFLIKIFGNTILWNSRKQGIVSLSTCEAEYIAASSAATETIWFNKVLNDMQIPVPKPIVIYEDNAACIMVSRNPETRRSKHIDVRYHYLRELTWNGTIELKQVGTKEQIADILTKPLPKPAFVQHGDGLSLN